MMRMALPLAAALALGACGGSEEQPPEEQIVVRAPGETAPAVATEAANDLVTAGEAAFAVCSACHTNTAVGPSGVGPNLYGVVGRKAGSIEGFSYSDAMASAAFVWDEASLAAYIGDPQGTVPGTSMAAGAVSDADKREAIVAYLGTLGE